MTAYSALRAFSTCRVYAAICLLFVFPALALADESSAKTSDPGFRPESEHTQAFIKALDTATIAVYPTLIRRATRTAISFESQDQIVKQLVEDNIAMAVAKSQRVDLGSFPGESQWSVFNKDMQRIAEQLTSQPVSEDYLMLMEFLLPVNNENIFGVHVYIFDQQGRSVFSFLLNSHHQSFMDARLTTKSTSEEARDSLIQRATGLGMAALQAQIERARVCGTHTEQAAIIPGNGVIDRFEEPATMGKDRFGNPIGFVAFTDGVSTVEVATTTGYPPLPSKIEPNAVLQIDINVTGWAAIGHIFESSDLDRWVALDWSGFDELSFWFFGNNSGTSLFVDVLDNRNACSTKDDAERYVYQFVDDFSGWERVSIRFADMVRKEVANDAPDDGLGLSSVHGWAIGALNTDGPITFYIDDVMLLRTPVGDVDYPINEIPMFGKRKKTASQKRADRVYIKTMTRDGRSREEAADIAAKTGWNFYYKGDSSTAIKRFNQSWLLDPDNQLALWGFGAISSERRQYEAGIRFFEMAIEIGPENSSLRRDYEFAKKQMERSR